MSIIQGNSHSGSGYPIANSLRLRSSASAYLSRTPTSAGNRKTWTYSAWLKRGALGAQQFMLNAGAVGNDDSVDFVSDSVRFYLNGGITGMKAASAVFRDPAAHVHFLFVCDLNNATPADRMQIWVNGTRVTAFSSSLDPASTYNTVWNNNQVQYIGRNNAGSGPLDGYLSDVYFIDGQALTPSSFGEFSVEHGQWVPKKYSGTYGTNGFYLPFNDGSSTTNLCLDRSGNGNNWSATGVSLTAGATYDWMLDTPTNNYATLNAIYTGRSTLSNCNLTASGATDLPTIIPESGSGTWYFEIGGVSKTWTPPAVFPSGSGDYNFGQRPWQSTGPTGGQKVLRTSDLSTPLIVNPKQHFDTVLATGANIKTASEAIFPSNFFEWIKDRANVNNHQLIDTVRGSSAILQSNTTGVETIYSTPTGSSVGWVWKAGGAAVSNTAGSITSQVSANTTAGLSVVTYTGTGANATVGHGLGVAPKMVITKTRGTGANWGIYHSGLDSSAPQSYILQFDTSARFGPSVTYWNSTAPTSSVFSVGTSGNTNTAGTMVAYCFAEIPGFSKIGSYTGNGSSDGPFAHCGFKPRFVMVKCSSATGGGWVIHDSARSTKNIADQRLSANISDTEYGSDGFGVDILSNGFKVRTADGNWNSNSQTYIFIAFAEAPFNYSTAR